MGFGLGTAGQVTIMNTITLWFSKRRALALGIVMTAGTIGGMGMAPSGDIGDRHAVFQPSHGTAPTIAGQGIANPIATILSGALMLDWLGERNGDPGAVEAGREIEAAVERVLAERQALPRDLGGNASTGQVGEAICRAVEG